jgi:hypothetical protein
MTTQSPYTPSGMNADAIVINPALTQNTDSTPLVLGAGRQGEQLVSEIHGKRYVSSSRGNLYWGTSGVAGSAPLAPGGTTGGFILYNPATSGVLVEVHQFRVSTGSTATEVISGLQLEGSVQAPSGTLTGCTVSQMPLGTSVGALTATSPAKAKVYGVATITAMTYLGNLAMSITATTAGPSVGLIDFDGTLVLSPGMCINVCSSITNTGKIILMDWLWSEWLP